MISKSEFRQDLVSGEWVVISPGRFKRPEQLKSKIKRKVVSKKGCPFEDPQKNGNPEPSVIYPHTKPGDKFLAKKNKNGGYGVGVYLNSSSWEIQVLENKFPIVSHAGNVCSAKIKRGPFSLEQGIGFHDLVLTRDHHKNFANLSKKSAMQVFNVFRERYLMLAGDKCLKYIFIFHNWGAKAGASIYHPHYQILSMPVIPPDVNRSLIGSIAYFKKHKKCVHCDMLEYELKDGSRIIYQNKDAVVLAPFVSKASFEIRIFPKKHLPYFEKTPQAVMESIVEALQKSLLKLEKKLGDPDYNFFIHTSPLNGNHDHYHWHIEILPKFAVYGGVELGTGVEVTTVDPDTAAKILR